MPYTCRPTCVSAGRPSIRLMTASLAASIRGPGASAWFIDPDASSTIITGTVGCVAGAAAAAAGLPPSMPTDAASRIVVATAELRVKGIGGCRDGAVVT